MNKKSTYYHLLSCGLVPLNLSHLAKKTKKKETFCVLIRQLGYCFSARGKDQQGFTAGSSHFENILLCCHFPVDPLRGGDCRCSRQFIFF